MMTILAKIQDALRIRFLIVDSLGLKKADCVLLTVNAPSIMMSIVGIMVYVKLI